MVKTRALFLGILLLFLVSSCSKEDESGTKAPENTGEVKGVLSFGSLLENFDDKNFKTVFGEFEEIPQCSDLIPKYVRVAVRNLSDNSWVAGKDGVNSFIEIEVNPNGSDSNGDNILDAWFTKESEDLELDAGSYSIEYFAVLDGNDANAEIIYLAPRKDDNYGPISFQNYVNKPLPIKVDILSGEKHYAPVEVLCYDKQLAIAFGYLFFDFTNPNFIYICSFGNVCDEVGRHSPAHFRLAIWKFDENGNYDASNLLVDEKNTISSIIDDDEVERFYGDLICVPLPDGPGEDKFFGQVYLIEEDQSQTLIREGSFTDTTILENLFNEEKFSLYHFRDDCCGKEDNFSLLTDLTTSDCDGQECKPCEGGVANLDLQYLGTEITDVTITTGGISIFDGTVNPNDIIELNKHGSIPSLGDEIKIFTNQILYRKLNTSCAESIGPGLLIGDFKIIAGESVVGGELCPIPPGDNPECQSCDGKVTDLSIRFNGPDNTAVKIKQDNDNSILFQDTVDHGEIINISQSEGSATMGDNIKIYVNSSYYGKFHTSCSSPIGPGLVIGDFKILSGASLLGGILCPVETPPDDCDECDGKVVELTLKYTGSDANIKIIQSKDGAILYDNYVNNNQTFDVFGSYDKNGKITMWTNIEVYINHNKHTDIHTSCSQPIGIGSIFGKFIVISGSSLNGGEFCPI